jgi:hypothetical protein
MNTVTANLCLLIGSKLVRNMKSYITNAWFTRHGTWSVDYCKKNMVFEIKTIIYTLWYSLVVNPLTLLLNYLSICIIHILFMVKAKSLFNKRIVKWHVYVLPVGRSRDCDKFSKKKDKRYYYKWM